MLQQCSFRVSLAHIDRTELAIFAGIFQGTFGAVGDIYLAVGVDSQDASDFLAGAERLIQNRMNRILKEGDFGNRIILVVQDWLATFDTDRKWRPFVLSSACLDAVGQSEGDAWQSALERI